MHRYASLIFLCLLLTFSTFSQQNKSGPGYRQLYQYAEKLFSSPNATQTTDSMALAMYMRVAAVLTREGIFNDTLVNSYLKSGILEMSGNAQEQALDFFRQAISVVDLHSLLNDSLLFKPCLYAGSIHYSLNNLDSAVYYYKKAEAINSRHPGLNESERLFNKFGALYFETGDYNKSISYFGKALSLVEKKKPVNIYFIINYQNNIATALMKLGRYDQALTIFRSLLQYRKPGDELLYNIGNTYFETENYGEALKYMRQIRNLEFEKFNGLTKLFIRLKQYDSARFYLARAKKYFQDKKNTASEITYGIMMKYSGDLKLAAGLSMEAVKDYQQAIHYLDPAFTDDSIADNPSSFTGLLDFYYLYDALVAKAEALRELGRQSIGTPYLEQCLNAYTSALTLAKHIEKTYFSDDARLFLKTKVNPATQDAVEVAIQLFKKTKDSRYRNAAFSFAENDKATVLQAGLKNLELTSIPGLPAGLVREEKKFRTLLAKLTLQAAQIKDSLLQAALRNKIHDIEVSLSSVQDKLDENPVYHGLKFYSSGIDMDSLQLKIPGWDEAILSYYYTSSDLICFYISKEGSGFTSVPLHDNLFSTIISLRKELQSPEASGRKSLELAGSALFHELVEPVFEKIRNKKRLIIIPFNEIGYVPFEMLKNPADGDLLLKNFSISYNYSAGFLTDKIYDQNISYDVLGMAPFSGKETAELVMPVLPSSINEIKGLPGKILSGVEAGKDQFISLSGQFPVIHLATHAVANDTNLLGSYIEFYGLKNEADSLHRLYEQEIYTLNMKSARLVILSACETGNGLLVNGEGVMSLSRAFSYAGCKSVVTSLWKADEISTSFICRRMHHYLQMGIAIDEALQKSKIDYLKSGEIEDRFKNPAYWAHLVLIGDFRAIVQPGFKWTGWMTFLSLFGMSVLIYLVRKNRT